MNIQDKLIELTGDKSWQHTDGPNSGTGVDYWLVNDKGDEAYANDDQGYVTISINGEPVWNNENECIEEEAT